MVLSLAKALSAVGFYDKHLGPFLKREMRGLATELKPQKTSDRSLWSQGSTEDSWCPRPVCNCCYLGYVLGHSFHNNDITQERDFWDVEFPFLPLSMELVLQESWQNLPDIGYMDFMRHWIYKNVINIHNYKFAQKVSQCVIYKALEYGGVQESPYDMTQYS